MKRTIILTTLLLTLAIAFPVLAQQAHHPGTDQGAAQMDTQALDSSMAQMKEMRQKMVTTKDPAARQKMMGEHMQQMKKMMSGMSMMNQGKMKGQGNMKGQGKMMGQGMSGCKMQGRGMQWMQMTEKKMQVMQEVIDGILAQQELQMKNVK